MRVIQQSVRVLLLLVVVLFGFNIVAKAETDDSVKNWLEPEQTVDEESDPLEITDTEVVDESSTVGITIWDFVKMIVATLFVIALLYFLLRFINKRNISYRDSQLIQNIAGTSVGSNRSIQMIKVGKRILVVGVGENIQLLKEVEDEEEVRQIIEEHNQRLEQLTSPSDIVTKVLERTKSFQKQDQNKEKNTFSSLLKTQLDQISKQRKKLFDEMDKKGPEDK
ncbi:flagellar biosynthetic protein FliO [Robertmurraya massiliosenegalensis]|uniref:flagellar biosynthetic protein FliO n=1 Tax=Robertmurraya massiliosenegalensis TaxID=1287657 RepID=UPI0002E09BE0|nr:flagellar biosynthetic protein FliO [Robertmurraya massiliosenegalensis]